MPKRGDLTAEVRFVTPTTTTERRSLDAIVNLEYHQPILKGHLTAP